MLMTSKTAGSLQEDIDDRQIDFRVFELLQSGRAARGFNDLETVDPEHDGDHPALIRLVVDDKNAGHERLPDRVQKPTTEPRIWTRTLKQPVGVFPEVSKDGVTRLGEPAAPRPVKKRVTLG